MNCRGLKRRRFHPTSICPHCSPVGQQLTDVAGACLWNLIHVLSGRLEEKWTQNYDQHYDVQLYSIYMYNLEPITLSRKNDKNFIRNITIRGLLVTSLWEYIRQNRKLSITFNFRFNMWDKKNLKVWRHMLLDPHPLSQTVTPSRTTPRAWRTLWTAPFRRSGSTSGANDDLGCHRKYFSFVPQNFWRPFLVIHQIF